MPLVAGRYEIGPMLGAGGFATVYRARDVAEDREVALKVIPATLPGEVDPLAAAVRLDRFRQEALALSRLRSRHVARVYDFGRDDGFGLYLVMELIEGVPLDVRSLGRALFPHEVLRVARGLLAGLAEAHGNGIVHRDVKPSNVLIAPGAAGLDEPRILDFGIARNERRARILAEALGRPESAGGVVLGTPAFMAPEQLREGMGGPASDVYAAGLVLYNLLGIGPLFPGESIREQIAARMVGEADVASQVAPPLGALLERMLARDPARRFADASQALEAIGDLETAPVSLADAPPQAGDDARHQGGDPDATQASAGPSPVADGQEVRTRPPPVMVLGAKRLSRLAGDFVGALIESLHALDLAMLDALGRRERGAAQARVARSVALALRLELDAAALVLEPLSATNDLARAFGATLVAPRARRATRVRVDADRAEAWVDAIDPELALTLAALGAAMTTRDDAARAEQRCRRVLARPDLARASSPTVTTVRMALVTAASLAGSMPASTALAEGIRQRDADREAPSPLNALLRSLLLGVVAFRADEHVAREQLERAARLAADTSNTLLETRALVAWGGMLVEIPERVEQGLSVLERAATLLAHGDAPSLEHIAEHNRGACLILQGRYDEAAPHLRRAREAAKGELSIEHETISCMNEGLATLCLGERDAAARVVDELSDARIAAVSPRTAAYSHAVRSIFAALYEDARRARSELRRAHDRAAEAEADGGDVQLLAESLSLLYAAARHEEIDLLARAGELQKLAQDRGFVHFYWAEVLRAIVRQMRPPELRTAVAETLERLDVLLGSATRSSAR